MVRLSIATLLVVVLLASSIITGCSVLNPNPVGRPLAQGDELCEQGRFDEAIEKYTAATKIAPNFYRPYYCRGIAYKLQGKKAEALADFEKALTLVTDSPGYIEMINEQIFDIIGLISKQECSHD